MRLLPLLLGVFACVPELKPPTFLENPDHDFDGDGYTENGGDCDDDAAAASPDAEETCGDGLDNNCDGSPGDCAPNGELDLVDVGPYVVVLEERGDGGWSVGALPDIDGNGASELLVGLPGYHRDADEDVGALLVANGPLDSNQRLDAGSWQVPLEADARTGTVVGSAGDFNGDGQVDALCTAPGSGGGVVGIFRDPLRGRIAWAAATSANVGDQLGASAVAAGDLDQDGYADLLAGAPGTDGGRGAVALVFGTTEDLPSFVTYTGAVNDGALGAAVLLAGDLTGDGEADAVASAPGAADTPLYRIEGPLTGGAAIDDVSTSVGPAADSSAPGSALAALGDVNGDGAPDFAVGDPEAGGGNGAVYILVGGESTLDDAWARIDGAGREGAGFSLAAPADLDGDSFLDLAIGAPGSDAAGEDAGAVYVFGGARAGVWVTLDAGLLLYGEDPGDAAGYAVGGAGDIDGDGDDDLAVGAPYHEVSGGPVGQVYLVLGGVGY